MASIIRKSSGVIVLVMGNSTLYITNPENATVKSLYGTTIIIDFLGINYIEIAFADLTHINGGVAPGTIALAVAAIAETVFNSAP